PDIGLPIPVVQTAMGRALAAILPVEEATLLDERLEADDAEQWAAYRDRFHAGIRDCAERGFCTCPGEYMAAIHAVAAPLFVGHDLKQVFAINCGVPAFRLQAGQLESEIGPRIRALAASIRALVDEAEPAIVRRVPEAKEAAG
ncbi:MAG: IclR family transcriptional regulator, partial [Proteobacteria bacterium]|nr:IclR family transcriptional regulator [Pseudomonadota bacterium]